MSENAEGQSIYKAHEAGEKWVVLFAMVSIFLILGQAAWLRSFRPGRSTCSSTDPRGRHGCGGSGDGTGGIEDPGAGGDHGEQAGAGGAVAVGITATAKADGYTILGHTTSSLTVIPHLESVSYKPLTDVIP